MSFFCSEKWVILSLEFKTKYWIINENYKKNIESSNFKTKYWIINAGPSIVFRTMVGAEFARLSPIKRKQTKTKGKGTGLG
jgi:hypothetical protein